jgi:chemotaxis protein CheC
VTVEYNELQLDALRELSNMGVGTAATALSQMLGQDVGLSVPRALALPLADAVDAAGAPEQVVTGIVIPIVGDLQALILLLIPAQDAETLCGLLGIQADSEDGRSALSEIGNILGASYMHALAAATALELDLAPPQIGTDLLASIVSAVLVAGAGETDTALVLDTALDLADHPCSVSMLLVPIGNSIARLLAPLGLAELEPD